MQKISGSTVQEILEKIDPDVRDHLQAQFDLSTSVRYDIVVKLRPYWPDRKWSETESRFQEVHKDRCETYERAMAKTIEEDIRKRDNKLMMELNDLLDSKSKIPVSIIVQKIKGMQNEE